MSSSNGSSFATELPSISGGIPTSLDLAPSVIFCILYVLILPVIVWRAWQCSRPFTLLLGSARLSLFAVVRLTTFIIRAVEAQDSKNGQLSPDLNPFIAEQIFLGIGYIVLATNVVSLVRDHIARDDVPTPGHDPRKFNAISRVMQVGLIAAIALGIVAGTQYGDAIDDPSTADKVKTERIASSVVVLVCTALAGLISGFLFLSRPVLPRASSAYLFFVSCIIVVIPAYRAASLSGSTSNVTDLISTKTKVEFWVLQVTLEYIALCLLLAVDIRVWFAAGGHVAREAMNRVKGQHVELGQVSPQGQYAIPSGPPPARRGQYA